MIRKWYHYYDKFIKGGVDVIYCLNKDDAVRWLSFMVIISFVLIGILWSIPPVSAELKPVSAHVCGSIVGDYDNYGVDDITDNHRILPNAGDAPCNGLCQITGDYCYRCEGACLNHPGLVSQLIGTEKVCVDSGGVLVRACCDPWITYCVFHCME